MSDGPKPVEHRGEKEQSERGMCMNILAERSRSPVKVYCFAMDNRTGKTAESVVFTRDFYNGKSKAVHDVLVTLTECMNDRTADPYRIALGAHPVNHGETGDCAFREFLTICNQEGV